MFKFIDSSFPGSDEPSPFYSNDSFDVELMQLKLILSSSKQTKINKTINTIDSSDLLNGLKKEFIKEEFIKNVAVIAALDKRLKELEELEIAKRAEKVKRAGGTEGAEGAEGVKRAKKVKSGLDLNSLVLLDKTTISKSEFVYRDWDNIFHPIPRDIAIFFRIRPDKKRAFYVKHKDDIFFQVSLAGARATAAGRAAKMETPADIRRKSKKPNDLDLYLNQLTDSTAWPLVKESDIKPVVFDAPKPTLLTKEVRTQMTFYSKNPDQPLQYFLISSETEVYEDNNTGNSGEPNFYIKKGDNYIRVITSQNIFIPESCNSEEPKFQSPKLNESIQTKLSESKTFFNGPMPQLMSDSGARSRLILYYRIAKDTYERVPKNVNVYFTKKGQLSTYYVKDPESPGYRRIFTNPRANISNKTKKHTLESVKENQASYPNVLSALPTQSFFAPPKERPFSTEPALTFHF